jgi:hypothetical protein
MMKKISAILMVLLLSLSMLAGCGGKAEPTATPTEKPPAEMNVTVKNSSGYIFNELYATPTADSEWGDDHLGSTSILKKGGIFEITLTTYNYNTYDIRVVDEDDDVYLFERVPLEEKCEIEIVWEDELAAWVFYDNSSKEDKYVVGFFASGSDDTYDDENYDWIDMTFYNGTVWDFTEVYIYEVSSSDSGYNHVANSPFNSYTESVIGVDYYDFYNVELLDTEFVWWVFKDVELGEGCNALITWTDENPIMSVEFTSGYVAEYIGTIV